MKKLVVIIILILNISVMHSLACSPETSYYITVEVKGCEERYEYHNIDVMVKEDGLVQSASVLEVPNDHYTRNHPDYESYDYLKEDGYVSHSAYLTFVDFTVSRCGIEFHPEDGFDSDLPYQEFYLVYFDENGNEMFRSQEYHAEDFYSYTELYFVLDVHEQEFEVHEIEFDGCAGAYNFVFGAMALVGIIGLIILSMISFTFSFGIVLVLGKMFDIKGLKKLIPLPIITVLYIVSVLFFGDIIDGVPEQVFMFGTILIVALAEIMLMYATMKEVPIRKIIPLVLILNSIIGLMLYLIL